MKTKNINPYKKMYKSGLWLFAYFVFFLVGSISLIVLLISKKNNSQTIVNLSPVTIVFLTLTAIGVVAIMIWSAIGLKITKKLDNKKLKLKLTLSLIPLLLIVWIFYFVSSIIIFKELEYKPNNEYALNS